MSPRFATRSLTPEAATPTAPTVAAAPLARVAATPVAALTTTGRPAALADPKGDPKTDTLSRAPRTAVPPDAKPRPEPAVATGASAALRVAVMPGVPVPVPVAAPVAVAVPASGQGSAVLPPERNGANGRVRAAAAGQPDAATVAAGSAAPQDTGRPLGAVRVPDSRRLLFDVTGEARRIRYGANAELLWQQDGSSYQARLEIAAMFVPRRVQTSAGQLTAQGLAPQRFSDRLRSELAAHFERDKGKISFSANSPDVPLAAGAQDRLSVLLQLGSLLAGEPQRYPPGSSISLQTVGPRDADDWRFVVGQEDSLALPGGPHRALKLSRAPVREFDLRMEVWLAADLAYLPVQLRLTQANGDFVELQLKSAEIP